MPMTPQEVEDRQREWEAEQRRKFLRAREEAAKTNSSIGRAPDEAAPIPAETPQHEISPSFPDDTDEDTPIDSEV